MESVKELEESLFQKINENPLDFNTLNKIGYIYLHSNNLLKSEEFYQRSIQIEPSQFEPFVSLGLISTITLRLGKALYYLLKAKESNSDAPDLLKSIEEIKTAILNKDSKQTNEELSREIESALSKLNENNVEESIENLLVLSCILPDNETVIINLAIALLRNQDYLIALNILTEFINKFPLNAMAYHYTALTANYVGIFKESREYFQKSLELKPSLADIASNGLNGYYKRDYSEDFLNTCPFCSGSDFKTENVLNQSVSSFNFNIINPLRTWVKCIDCNFIFANPRPSKYALQKYSLELFYHSMNLLNTDIDRITLETNAYNERINLIENYTVEGKSLDINSDCGIFLSVARTRGWDIAGIEENLLKTKVINSIYNFDVKNLSFENYKNNEKLNLITLWESIGKIPDFIDVLKKINKLLKKDGIFAFSFHSSDSYLSKTLGKNYPLWAYPDHINFFDCELMRQIVQKTGFKVLKIQHSERKYLGNVEFYCKK